MMIQPARWENSAHSWNQSDYSICWIPRALAEGALALATTKQELLVVNFYTE